MPRIYVMMERTFIRKTHFSIEWKKKDTDRRWWRWRNTRDDAV